MEEIYELLMKSRLDATGLCIMESDIRKLVDAVNRFEEANLRNFRINRTTKDKGTEKDGALAYYSYNKVEIVFFINRIRDNINRILNLKVNKEKIAKLSNEELEILIKSIVMLTILHEFDHTKQHQIISKNDVDNPDYLLLLLSQGKFKAKDNETLEKIMEYEFGPRISDRMGAEYGILMRMLYDDHDLIPYERMANFHAYEQIVKILNLSAEEHSRIINIIKLLRLKPLIDYYKAKRYLKCYDNYDGTNSPSIYFISNIGGICYYGESFQSKLLRLYRDYPLAYRFYAGLVLTKEEIDLYNREIRSANAHLKK